MKKIAASTIAEVVIALTIIAICFAVASRVFVQTVRSTIQFKEVKEQTEFQSLMLNALICDTLPGETAWKGDLARIQLTSTAEKGIRAHLYELTSSHKKIWSQQLYSEKQP